MFVVKLKRMAFVATRARHKRVAESVSVRRQSIESNPQLHTDNANNQRPASRLRRTGIDGAIDRYRAPALDKGLDILELLSEQKEGLTRTEITKELGRNASEIYRMLERLVARRYVMRSTGGDRYTLSLAVLARAPPSADEPADRRGVAADAAFRRCLRAIVSPVRLRSRQPARDRAGRRPVGRVGPARLSCRKPSIRHRGA